MDNEKEQKELEFEIAELEEMLANKKEQLERVCFLQSNGKYFLNEFGEIQELFPGLSYSTWAKAVKQNNAFKTVKDAEKERDRRALLYEFNQFRDECNAGEEIEWNLFTDKYYIGFNNGEIDWFNTFRVTDFAPFGYFNKKEHCLEAIEKFGDRIKKLYID